jgi:DNA-binding FrmR family transcriptional regulator
MLTTMRFPEDVTKDALNRLRRAEGQLRGVQRLLEDGADCKDVVTQISAVQAALHRAGLRLMASGMRHCIADPAAAESEGMTVADMENLFLKLR